MRNRLVPFLRRQIREVRRGGLRVVLRKGVSLIELVLAVPLVLAARLLRPLILIRFGGMHSARFCHFATDLEVYLCERDAGLHGRRVVDLFYYVQPVCNQQLKKMWDRVLPVSRLAYWAARLNSWLPGGQPHVVPWPFHADHDLYGLWAHTKPHLSFTPAEEQRGFAALQALGVLPGVAFVGIYARDPAARDVPLASDDLRRGRRDCRDSEIETYLPAAEALVRLGYVVLRLGKDVERALPTTNPKIIDYPNTPARSDFLDVFLGARGHFVLGDSGGISGIPLTFRRPLAMVNQFPLESIRTGNPCDLLIFKKLWLRKESRLLTLRETFVSGLGRRLENFALEWYDRLGIDVIDNTPEEITAVAVEIAERLNGTWRTTEGDEELQQRVWAIYKDGVAHRRGQNLWRASLDSTRREFGWVKQLRRYGWSPQIEWTDFQHQVFRSRIGAEFLRQNREWLLEDTLPAGPVVISLR